MATIKPKNNIIVFLLRCYQWGVSPMFGIGSHCRFYPSCSTYAIEAYRSHNMLKATVLTFGRLLRCHPWCQGGVDLVPKPNKK